MYKYIISSISESETAYVDCLNTLLQVIDGEHKTLTGRSLNSSSC